MGTKNPFPQTSIDVEWSTTDKIARNLFVISDSSQKLDSILYNCNFMPILMWYGRQSWQLVGFWERLWNTCVLYCILLRLVNSCCMLRADRKGVASVPRAENQCNIATLQSLWAPISGCLYRMHVHPCCYRRVYRVCCQFNAVVD